MGRDFQNLLRRQGDRAVSECERALSSLSFASWSLWTLDTGVVMHRWIETAHWSRDWVRVGSSSPWIHVPHWLGCFLLGAIFSCMGGHRVTLPLELLGAYVFPCYVSVSWYRWERAPYSLVLTVVFQVIWSWVDSGGSWKGALCLMLDYPCSLLWLENCSFDAPHTLGGGPCTHTHWKPWRDPIYLFSNRELSSWQNDKSPDNCEKRPWQMHSY